MWHPAIAEVIEQSLHGACCVHYVRRGSEDQKVCFKKSFLDPLDFFCIFAEMLIFREALYAADAKAGAVFGKIEFRYLCFAFEWFKEGFFCSECNALFLGAVDYCDLHFIVLPYSLLNCFMCSSNVLSACGSLDGSLSHTVSRK